MIISIILVTLMFDSGLICKEKLDAGHSKGQRVYQLVYVDMDHDV